ncbi:MAG: hypothetical protein ACP5T3_02475 [Candidatus Micrarchaeia archaeon]
MNLNIWTGTEASAFLALARSKKAQSSLEYIMMIAAASIVIVLAVAMVVKLKGAVVTTVNVNGTNESIAQAISKELGSLTANAIQ